MAKIAIVVPAYNEEKNIPLLYRRLNEALSSEPDHLTYIFVDDGSSDGTEAILRDLSARDTRVRAVLLSRNFGHQPALMAGIDAAAEHDAVVLMDADLQDLPEAIPEFLNEWRSGNEVVYAIRVKRKESSLKVAAFSAFYRLQRSLVSLQMPLDAGIFSLMDRKVIDAIRRMPEHNRYLVGLRAYAGFRQKGVVVERGLREDGKPRVSFLGLCRLALDGIFAFSTLPLRFIMTLGLFVSAFSFFFAAVGLVVRYVLGVEFLHWPFGLSTILFFGGVQLVSTGVLGEYIGRIYDEVKRRPYYFVGEIVQRGHVNE
jgi:dolichol-phosphate mannosyltransferase